VFLPIATDMEVSCSATWPDHHHPSDALPSPPTGQDHDVILSIFLN